MNAGECDRSDRITEVPYIGYLQFFTDSSTKYRYLDFTSGDTTGICCEYETNLNTKEGNDDCPTDNLSERMDFRIQAEGGSIKLYMYNFWDYELDVSLNNESYLKFWRAGDIPE